MAVLDKRSDNSLLDGASNNSSISAECVLDSERGLGATGVGSCRTGSGTGGGATDFGCSTGRGGGGGSTLGRSTTGGGGGGASTTTGFGSGMGGGV